MKFEVKNRFTGDTKFAAEIECLENEPNSKKLRLAVLWAIANNADLRGADLGGAYLRGADLRDADLRGVYLRDADLGGADLGGAYLGGVDLGGADLRDADLRDADLRGVYLRGADLRGADLGGADLGGAYLGGAYLRSADLLCMGNMIQIKTLQFDKWGIGYTHDTLQIGCQRHAIQKWRKWNTKAGRGWIAKMDDDALMWADKYMELVLSIIDASPAKPTGTEAL